MSIFKLHKCLHHASHKTHYFFITETSPLKRTALFWVITQRVVVIPYRRLGTNNRPHLHGTDTLSQNVGNKLPLPAHRSAVPIHFAAEAWNHPGSLMLFREMILFVLKITAYICTCYERNTEFIMILLWASYYSVKTALFMDVKQYSFLCDI